jgi:hypothetical protein
MSNNGKNLSDENTVTLHTYNDISEAKSVVAKLEANGIRSFIHDDNVMGMDPVSGVELKVFEKDVQRAEEIINGE